MKIGVWRDVGRWGGGGQDEQHPIVLNVEVLVKGSGYGNFPDHEHFSLTDQRSRFSRPVAAKIVESWRKRRYRADIVSKFNDSEGKSTKTWSYIEIGMQCGHLSHEAQRKGLNRFTRKFSPCSTSPCLPVIFRLKVGHRVHLHFRRFCPLVEFLQSAG